MLGNVAELIEVLKTLPQDAQLYSWNVDQVMDIYAGRLGHAYLRIDIHVSFMADDIAGSKAESTFAPRGLPAST